MDEPTRMQLNQWEIEYIKCDSRKKLLKYIEKYGNTPQNPYLQEAKNRISQKDIPVSLGKQIIKDVGQSITSAGSSSKSNKKDDGDWLKAAAVIIPVAIAIFLGVFISANWRDWVPKNEKPGLQTPSYVSPVVVTTEDEYEAPVETETTTPKETKRNTPSAINPSVGYPGYYPVQPAPNVIYEPHGPTGPDPRWENFYRNAYSEMERQAERDYNSLTNLGAQYQHNGHMEGTTGRDDVYVAQQKSLFRQKQHEMRNLRHEAATKGIQISPSHWENAVVY